MRHCFLLLLLCLFSTTNFANSETIEDQIIAEAILGKLFNAYGNFIYPIPPKIEIVNEKKRVAAFIADKKSGRIIIEQAAIEVCRSFGKDYESALAFIIGHELGHFFDRTNNKGFATNYLKWTHTQKEEEKADIWGVFCSYLAEYRTVSIVPNLIEALYEEYNLMEKKDELYGYPSFKVRKEVAQNVRQQVEELIHIFDMANLLSTMGKHELAASSYKYILQFYQGREIYNNLGVNYALEAMNFTTKNVDRYLYPFEIDTNTRIKKPKLDRGGEDLTEKEQAYRMKMLEQAKKYLEIAGKMDYNYLSDDINMMGVLNLMMDLCKECENPVHYYEKHQLLKTASFIGASEEQKAQLQLALALAYAKTGKKEAAKNIWTSLKNHSNPQIKYQANFNLEALKEDYSTSFIKIYDSPAINIDLPSDNVRPHRVEIEEGFVLDSLENIKVEIRPLKNSTISIFEDNKGNIFLVQSWEILESIKVDLQQSDKYQLIAHSNGFYLMDNASFEIYSISSTGLLREYVRFYDN